jgi:hypothetical protein
MLVELVNTPDFRQHPAALKLLNKMIQEQNPQVGALHSFVHNSYSAPSGDQLISFWEIFEPIFVIVLNEPTTVATPAAGSQEKTARSKEQGE